MCQRQQTTQRNAHMQTCLTKPSYPPSSISPKPHYISSLPEHSSAEERGHLLLLLRATSYELRARLNARFGLTCLRLSVVLCLHCVVFMLRFFGGEERSGGLLKPQPEVEMFRAHSRWASARGKFWNCLSCIKNCPRKPESELAIIKPCSRTFILSLVSVYVCVRVCVCYIPALIRLTISSSPPVKLDHSHWKLYCVFAYNSLSLPSFPHLSSFFTLFICASSSKQSQVSLCINVPQSDITWWLWGCH